MTTRGRLTTEADKRDDIASIISGDTGTVIPEEVQPNLFTPLFTTKAKGQGFGLAVIKCMTEAMGGIVTFEIEKGRGTKFIVNLPFRKAKKQLQCGHE